MLLRELTGGDPPPTCKLNFIDDPTGFGHRVTDGDRAVEHRRDPSDRRCWAGPNLESGPVRSVGATHMTEPTFEPLDFREHPAEDMVRRVAAFHAEMSRRRTVRHFSDRRNRSARTIGHQQLCSPRWLLVRQC